MVYISGTSKTFLNEPSGSKFVTRKWNIVNDKSNANYNPRNEIIYNAEVLNSNLCDFHYAYILVRGDITIRGNQVTQVAFKNYAPFTKCITKIDGTAIDDDEDLIIQMYNLIKYNSNYSETKGISCFYSRDEATHFDADIANNNNNFKTFEYKAKFLGKTEADGNNGVLKNAKIPVELKYLTNFWR